MVNRRTVEWTSGGGENAPGGRVISFSTLAIELGGLQRAGRNRGSWNSRYPVGRPRVGS